MTESIAREFRNGSERLMLAELTHRMNNELASAIGVITVAASEAESAATADLFIRVRQQLENFARVHHVLAPPDLEACVDGGACLRSLCEAICISRLYARGIEVELIEHPLQLDSRRCWMLVVIVYELICNAISHAFGDRSGRITVEVIQRSSFIEARIEDTGRGKSSSSSGSGRGLGIIGAFAQDLGGQINQRFSVNGSVTTLVFPASVAAGGAPEQVIE